MIKRNAPRCFCGPPLVKMATGERSRRRVAGRHQMHARISGFGRLLSLDRLDAIRIGRHIVARLNLGQTGTHPAPVTEPLFDAEELIGVMPPDLRIPFDPRLG